MSTGIKEIIKNYIEIDDQIKELTKQITPLKASKNALGIQISEYLTSNSDKPNAVLEVGKDIFKIINVKKSRVNKDIFESVISAKTSEKVAKDIMAELTEEKEEVYLRRLTKK
jgi:seryl-tRNA synthetase